MGNYFTATKITTHDNTISSECNIDIFVNKKSLDENLEIVENLEPIGVKTDTNDIEPLKVNEGVKIDNNAIDQSPQTTLTSKPVQPPQITPQPVENKSTEAPRSLRPTSTPMLTSTPPTPPSPKSSPKPSPKSSPKPSPKSSPKPSPKSSQSIIGGELKARSDSDLSINEEVSSDDNTINTQIQKHKKRNKKKKKNVSEIKPEIKPQTEL